MKKLILLLLVSISLTGCKDAPDLPDTCTPSSKFGKAYCGTYSLQEMQWITPLKKKPLNTVDDAICMSKKTFLTIFKPYVKDNYRAKKDSQKKKLYLDGALNIRETYKIR